MARYAATGLFSMMALLILRDYGVHLRSALGATAAMSGAGYGVCTYLFLPQEALPIQIVFLPFCIMGPVLVWLFSLSLFQDEFRLRPVHGIVPLSYLALNLVFFNVLWDRPGVVREAVFICYSLLRFGLIVHMLYVAWQGKDEDLLESRRRFRTFYAIAVGFTISVIFVRETFFLTGGQPSPVASLIQSSLFFLLAAFVFWHATKANTDILLQQSDGEGGSRRAVQDAPDDAAGKVDIDEVQRLMNEEKLYLEPGLSVARLASAAKLPEHRLRRLINQYLGYRNFPAFVNDYRIGAAKEHLADREKRHVPVLTIAMDLGYGSLGPFNRAFKERTGQTPTEYRRKMLASQP